VVFPNISRRSTRPGHPLAHPMEMAMLREDLDPAGESFVTLRPEVPTKDRKRFSFLLQRLTGKEEAKLHLALWPEGRFACLHARVVGRNISEERCSP